MDFLDERSPVWALKRQELAIYLDRWQSIFRPGARVLDLGGGIGRFVPPCIEFGCNVVLVDADPDSLACATRHFAELSDRIVLVHARAENLPDLGQFDVVIACELLNYVDSPEAVVRGIEQRLRPGGYVLASVEAQFGWALAVDAPPDQLGALLDDGVVHVEGDRWVRTYSPERLQTLFSGFEIEDLVYTHFTLSGPFERVAGEINLNTLLANEARLRAHPVLGRLGRALTLTARRPTGNAV